MRRAVLILLAAAGCLPAVAGAQTGGIGLPPPAAPPPPAAYPPIAWRASLAIGRPWDGKLVRGVQLPAQGADFFTWDPVYDLAPNRGWRRWGHDRLLRKLLRVLAAYRLAHPGVARVGIEDISRRHGGVFDERFGGLGHKSHQIGLDVDVLYPRLDRAEVRATRVREIDKLLAQDLVDRFVAARAQYVFVGPHTGLTGKRRVVQTLAFHDDHMHVRFRQRRSGR